MEGRSVLRRPSRSPVFQRRNARGMKHWDRGTGARAQGDDEHGYREGCCDGESEVAEFEEEGCEGNGLLGVRGGVLF